LSPPGRAPYPTPGRPRLLIGTLLLLVVVVVATALVGRWALRERLDARIDRALVEQVEEFQRLAAGTDPSTGVPFGTDVAAVFDVFFAANVPGTDGVFLGLVGNRPYLRSADTHYPIEELDDLVTAWTSRATSTYGEVATPAGPLRYLVSPVTDGDESVVGSLVVGRFPAEERADLDAAAWMVAVVGLAVLALAGAGVWILGRRFAPALPADVAPGTSDDGASEAPEIDSTDPAGPTAAEITVLRATVDRLEAELDGAQAAQQLFLRDAGRELGSPATVIRAHLEDADPNQPLAAPTRALVLDELARMHNIVADLTLLAASSGGGFLEPGPVDVADLTEEVGARARQLGERDWDVRPGALVVARMDRDRIVQAWLHLARNAVGHTWRGDRISIFSGTVGDELELGVVDAGRGIDPGEVEEAFVPFRRGRETARTSTDGGGLGLSVVLAVAEAHGGRVEVRDTPGGGATVALVIPLVLDVIDPGPLGEEPRWEQAADTSSA